jgi:hypothetical protein
MLSERGAGAERALDRDATTHFAWLMSLGGDLYLETDVINHDRYDRLLRYAGSTSGMARSTWSTR